jgi:hypothetical protein
MLNNQVFYHGIIRKTIVSFGSLFSDIYIDRKKDDSVEGETVQRLQIPLAYAPKEKWIVRIDSDPNLENHTYVSLPRMSFEITGYQYDSSRKTNRMQKITCGDGSTAMSYMYSPVPYNIEISLYVLTKTQEDAMQIIEQILPTFTPEYTLSINAVPDMNVIQDIPVILNNITVQDDYDGDFQTRRFVTHTLNFTLKTNLFGANSSQGVIAQVTANIGQNENFTDPNRVYVADGDVTTATITNETWTSNF